MSETATNIRACADYNGCLTFEFRGRAMYAMVDKWWILDQGVIGVESANGVPWDEMGMPTIKITIPNGDQVEMTGVVKSPDLARLYRRLVRGLAAGTIKDGELMAETAKIEI